MVARRQGEGRLAVVGQRWLVDGNFGGLVVMDLGLIACRSEVRGPERLTGVVIAVLQSAARTMPSTCYVQVR